VALGGLSRALLRIVQPQAALAPRAFAE